MLAVRDPGFVGETDGLQSRELFSLYLSKAELGKKNPSAVAGVKDRGASTVFLFFLGVLTSGKLLPIFLQD